jgi:predicted dehydrogenase
MEVLMALEKLNVVSIGCGGMGWADVTATASHPEVNIAGCVDVDANRLKNATDHFKCEGYADWREMYAEMGDKIDAVIVSTPDHTHAPAAMEGLNRDKHVYCQKPLTWCPWEARQLSIQAELKPHLSTQMGTQLASTVSKRQGIELMRNGVMGAVEEIHGWSDRPSWVQGQPRVKGSDPIPDHLDWDLWLGVAPVRPYKNGRYHPGQWRGVFDFGCGAIGDMACHIMDAPYYAFDLFAPMAFRTDCDDATEDQMPTKQIVKMTFPGNIYSSRDSIPFTWYDGGLKPSPKAMGLPDDFRLPSNACIVIGDEGTFLAGHGSGNRLFIKGKEVPLNNPKIEDRNHWHHWVDGCFGRVETMTNFGFAARLTESMVLGAVGARFPGETLVWDTKNVRVTNKMEANAFVRRKYRKGFEVENL